MTARVRDYLSRLNKTGFEMMRSSGFFAGSAAPCDGPISAHLSGGRESSITCTSADFQLIDRNGRARAPSDHLLFAVAAGALYGCPMRRLRSAVALGLNFCTRLLA